MLEDYVVTARLPFDETADAAILGADFGLNADPTTDSVWYSDGQDLWFPAAASTVYAAFRGQVRFIPNGHPDLEPPPETPPPPPPPDTEPPALLPALGDCLVLELWPQDYLKLRELLPDPLLVPKRIVYQNVDRTSALDRATALVERHAEHYEKLFLEDGETELVPAEIARRARIWLETEWVTGRGVGVYVDPREAPVAIAEAAPPPATAPAGLPTYARLDHGTPSGAAGFSRLTLKVLDENGRLLHPANFFYLLSELEDDALVKDWATDSLFIREQVAKVAELPAVRVVARLEDDESAPPDPDPPPALPMIRLRIRHTAAPVWISGLYDPFDRPEQGYWRFQSELPPGDYEDTYDAPPLYAQVTTPRGTTASDVHSREYFREVRHPHWLPFHDPDSGQMRRRFVLGVNMETCRRRHYHDLSATDLLYQYVPVPGGDRLETTYAPTSSGIDVARTPWLSQPGNREALRHDLEAIRATGATAVRVWVFEYLEGIRFEFTNPSDPSTGRGSALANAREDADRRSHSKLRSYVFPAEGGGAPITVHACRGTDFADMAAGWSAAGARLRVMPQSNPLFQELLENAAQLQAMAGAHGLRVLWTLMTHYGESKPPVNGEPLIYYTQDRPEPPPPRLDASGRVPVDEWVRFYMNLAPIEVDGAGRPREGRVAVEAWIYRMLLSVDTVRQSYIDNALIPFVQRMESVSGEPLGYEVCNEIDILWDSCTHGWSNRLAGIGIESNDVPKIVNRGGQLAFQDRPWSDPPEFTKNFPTRWKLTHTQIRTFVDECAAAVRGAIPAGRHRLILSGVLGSHHGSLPEELMLLRPAGTVVGDPPLRLSASAFTKYAYPASFQGRVMRREPVENVWKPWDGRHGLFSISDLHAAMGVYTDSSGVLHRHDQLLHGERCLMIEAGDSPRPPGHPARQSEAFRDLLRLGVAQGYAGIFAWHYHDPGRTRSAGNNHPLTKGVGFDRAGPSIDLHNGIEGRQAVREIQNLARTLGRLRLPPAPWP